MRITNCSSVITRPVFFRNRPRGAPADSYQMIIMQPVIIDTGASTTLISRELQQLLSLEVTATSEVAYANSSEERCDKCIIHMEFGDGTGIDYLEVLIQEKRFIAPNGNSYNCLLGMDVLGKGILVYDGRIQEALHKHIE